ncbi:MAG: SpoIIE family protein phosphatase [Treponema sp.]|nr:SpoIIE family protein phosphatase [Treponema sp.]
MAGHIKYKVLKALLGASLGALLFVTGFWLVSTVSLRNAVISMNDRLGEVTAENSQAALSNQLQDQLIKRAQTKAILVDERLLTILNQTERVADMASRIYTNKDLYRPRSIGYLEPDQIGTAVPHIRTAPGVSLESIRNEVFLAANISDVLSHITLMNIGINASYIGGASGYTISVDQRDSGVHNTNFDVTNRGWYKAAQEKDGLIWTVMLDALGRGIGIYCARPFYDRSGGKPVFKGVAGSGTLLAEYLEYILDPTLIGNNGYLFLLNEKGQVLISPYHLTPRIDEGGNILWDDYRQSDDPAVRDLAERMIRGETGLVDGILLNNRLSYVAYHPLSVINWSLGIVIPMQEVLAQVQGIRSSILSLTDKKIEEINFFILKNFIFNGLIIAVTVGVTVFVSGKLSHSLTAPIIALSKGATDIGAGNLKYRFNIKTGDELEMLAETFNQMIENITYISGEKERIGTELSIATKIQASMLPCIFPPFPDRHEFDIYAEMHPAKEVGGDFYDFFFIDENRVAVIIADVSGKGVPAALFMVVTKTLIKDHALMDKSLDEVFYTVNNQLCETNQTGMFVTVFMGILEINTGKFRYVNAGHNPPLIRQGGGEFTWLETKPGLALAIIEGVRFQVMETVLAEGDMVFLYTDGVTEAMDKAENLFSNRRMLETINRDGSGNNTINEHIGAMLRAVQNFARGAEQADDITMLILERKKRC